MKRRVRFILVLVGIVVLLGLIAVAAVVTYRALREEPAQETPVDLAIDPIDADVRAIQDLESEGKLDEARDKARAVLDDSSISDQKRRDVTRALANLEANTGNHDATIELLGDSPQEVDDHIIAYDIGIAYERKGETDRAIAFYERAIELWPSDDPARLGEISYLERHIQELEERES